LQQAAAAADQRDKRTQPAACMLTPRTLDDAWPASKLKFHHQLRKKTKKPKEEEDRRCAIIIGSRQQAREEEL
jgi:hypothetical protein